MITMNDVSATHIVFFNNCKSTFLLNGLSLIQKNLFLEDQ